RALVYNREDEQMGWIRETSLWWRDIEGRRGSGIANSNVQGKKKGAGHFARVQESIWCCIERFYV
ncbi:MAG: hypothetical protein ACFFCW_48375, partial [Candidatus Hodarchaeota archaeon]